MKTKTIGKTLFVAAFVAIILPLFTTCIFESDGNFSGQIAGRKRSDVLLPPSNVRAAGDSSGIKLTWEVSDNADGYTIYRAPADNPTRYVRRGSSGVGGYIDSGASVPPDTPFYYYVTAYNSAEASKPSDTAGPVQASRNEGILEAPNITNAVVSGNSIIVTWTSVSGATGYILYRASMYDGDVYIVRINTEMVSFTDENLADGSYLYQVRGVKDGIDGYTSHIWGPVNITTSTVVVPAPAKPQILNAVVSYSPSSPTISVSWNAVANATKYIVYRSVDDEYYEKVGEVSTTAYQDNTGKSGEAYYYRVRGYNGSQEGYLSDSYGPVLTRPGKPEITASVSNNTVTVNWTPVYGADIYYVYRSLNNSQFQLLTARGTGNTSYIDSGLASGTYSYYVEAANSAGRGLQSDTKQATVLQNAAPPVITVHPVGNTYLPNVPANPLTVQANASDGGSLSYQWYRNTSNSNSGGTQGYCIYFPKKTVNI